MCISKPSFQTDNHFQFTIKVVISRLLLSESPQPKPDSGSYNANAKTICIGGDSSAIEQGKVCIEVATYISTFMLLELTLDSRHPKSLKEFIE